MKKPVFVMIIVSLTFLGLRVKIYRVGTIGAVRCVGFLLSTIQFLCISVLEAWLNVTRKRQAEISADIFVGLLRYFSLSYRNLATSDAHPNVPFFIAVERSRGSPKIFYRFFFEDVEKKVELKSPKLHTPR